MLTPTPRLHIAAASWLLILWPGFVCGADRQYFDAWTAGAGLGLMNFDLKEFDRQDQRLVHESGWLPGIDTTLAAANERVEIAFAASYYDGDVDYDGQTQSGIPIDSTTDQTIWNLSAIAAYRLAFLFPPQVQLYAGAGYRHWERDIQSVGTVSGLDETYRWWSYQAGMKLEWIKGPNLWRVDGRLTRTMNPEVEIDFKNAFDSATLDLGERWGWKTELSWRHRITARLGAGLSAYYENWDLGRSDVETLTSNGFPVGTVVQPRIENNNYGFILELQQSW